MAMRIRNERKIVPNLEPFTTAETESAGN